MASSSESNASFWLQDNPLKHHRTTVDLPSEVDFVVVGAGITGCTAALHLSRLGASCLVLDAREVCGGATGRNGGHMWRWTGEGCQDQEQFALRAEFERRSAQDLANFIEEHKVECDFQTLGGVELAMDDTSMEELKKGPGRHLDADTVQRMFNSRHGHFVGGMLHEHASTLWPARLVFAIAQAAIAAGANLQTHTKVLGIDDSRTNSSAAVSHQHPAAISSPSSTVEGERSSAGDGSGGDRSSNNGGGGGGGCTVRTARGAVTARRGVVVCINGWTGSLIPELTHCVLPLRNQVLVTAPLGRRVWAAGWAADSDYWYGFQRADGRLCLGAGEDHVTDDSELSSELSEKLRGMLRDGFEGVEDVCVDWEWSGLLAYTPDGLPLLGKVPGRECVWVCGAYGGHAMPVAMSMAAAVAEMAYKGLACPSEPYLATLSPDRFAADGGGGGERKGAVKGEKASQVCRSLRDKDAPQPPAAAAAAFSWALPPLFPASNTSAPTGGGHGGSGVGGVGGGGGGPMDAEMEEELERLFADVGVDRGRDLWEALRPSLEQALPSMEPAVGDLISGHVVRRPTSGK